jgi:RNA polymerase sigma factor (sigma-70 family)
MPGVGIDAMPPPASGLPARLVLGPALRAQSDGRLVGLVRDGYESAFEEIVRRYRRPLDRFAAGIVGGRSEDVTQDSFRKALEALRRGDAEVELRPWLYRIVRNTALNDLRDRPPAAAELVDDLVGGGRSAAVEAEERAEVAALTARLRALPEKQRAALVMRELEGMSHEEIAETLGISGGAARQAIARGRAAVRSGFGALVPLPLLRVLAGGGDGAAEAAVGTAVGGSAVAVGGGLGAAGALKVGLATVFVAGSIGAGVAIDHHGAGHHRPAASEAAAPAPGRGNGSGLGSTPSPVVAEVDDRHGSRGEDGSGEHGSRHGDDGRHGRGRDDGGRGHGSGDHRGTHGGPGTSGEGGGSESSGRDDGSGDDSRSVSSGSDGGGAHHDGGQSGADDGTGGDGAGHSGSGGSGSGSGRGSGHGSSGSGSGGSSSGGGSRHGGNDSDSSGGGSGSGSDDSTRDGSGSDDLTEAAVETETAATSTSGGSESSSGSDDSGSSGDSSSSGSSGGPSPTLDLSGSGDGGSGSSNDS